MRISDWSSDVCSSDLSSRILASAGAPTGQDPIARRLAKTRTMRDRLRPLPLSYTKETNMLLEKMKTLGLSYLSYLIGSGGKAAVTDSRRDCECYVEMARAEGLEITHIFETHRNEDLVLGAPILKAMIGAR